MKRSVLQLFGFLNQFVPKSKDRLLFISSPDLSDNSFALFVHMLEHTTHPCHYTWLVEDLSKRDAYLKMIAAYAPSSSQKRICFIPKRSLGALWHFMRAKYVFFTHGFFTGIPLPRHQIRLNLWHGMPLKAIGHLNPSGDSATIPKASAVIATSPLYQDVMGRAFDLPPQKVWVTGQPRCDLMREPQGCLERLGIKKETYARIIFWAPTFRVAKDHDIQDGTFNGNLPLMQEGDLERLNTHLASMNACMVVKLHPMDILNTYALPSLSHIVVLQSDALQEKGCQLYALLSEVDILLTDLSSIYIDFLLLDRPIVFGIDDLEAYRSTRGYVFEEPQAYMPGPQVHSVDALIDALTQLIVDGEDTYAQQRQALKARFHTHERDFSNRILERLKIG